jgi:hypothetical protein
VGAAEVSKVIRLWLVVSTLALDSREPGGWHVAWILTFAGLLVVHGCMAGWGVGKRSLVVVLIQII